MPRIGVLVDLIGRYGRGILEGVSTFSNTHGQFQVITPPLYSFAHFDNWENWQVDGMIVQFYCHQIVEHVETCGIPAVNVSTILSDHGIPTVSSDDAAIGKMAAEYFLHRGFRNFAFLGEGSHYALARGDAFQRHICLSGFTCHRPNINLSLAHKDSEIRAQLLQNLRAMPLPICIFCPNDPIAMLVLEACAEAGIAVPERAAVLGCDNDELLFRRTNPPLSSIHIPAEQIGYDAAQTLLDLMNGKPVPQHQMLKPLSVINRKSTDVLAVNDNEVAQALRFIRTHAHEQILVNDVVAHVPMSRRGLEQRFRQVVGRSPLAEIRRVQLELSCQLLIETDLAMPEIAKRCGFANASYFGISFRKNLGITPTAFRRRSNEKNRKRDNASGIHESISVNRSTEANQITTAKAIAGRQ